MRLSLAAALALTLSARSAVALEGGAGVEMNFPLDLGVVGELDLPWRLGAALSVGWVPPPFIDVITAAGGDPTVDQVLQKNLDSAMTVGVELRARLWRQLWLGTGFRWFGLKGGFISCDLLQLAGVSGGCGAAMLQSTRKNELEVSSNIYAMTFTLGWRFYPHERVTIFTGGGFLLALASSNSAGTRAAQSEARLDAYLDDLYTTYLKVPFLGVNTTYRFGGSTKGTAAN